MACSLSLSLYVPLRPDWLPLTFYARVPSFPPLGGLVRGKEMSRSLSCPSEAFRQRQDEWTLTCMCVTPSGVPKGLGGRRGWRPLSATPDGLVDPREIRVGVLHAIPALAHGNKSCIIRGGGGGRSRGETRVSLAPDLARRHVGWGRGTNPFPQVRVEAQGPPGGRKEAPWSI